MNIAANIINLLFSTTTTAGGLMKGRAALAAEIAEWNSKVKRRNRRFVARQLARGRSAS